MLGSIIVKMKAGNGFKYLNERNLDKFINDWHDDAVFIYPGNVSASGEHQGKQAIRSWWQHFFEQFPESYFTCHNIYISNCFALGPSNEITFRWSVKARNKEGKSFSNKGVSVVKLVNGKIARFEDYFSSTDNMAEAWSEG